jgi:hypothetical protein
LSDLTWLHSAVPTTHRIYPTAAAGPASIDPESPSRLVVWFADQVERLGGEPLVYLPTRRSVRDEHVLSYIVRSTAITTHTWRSLPTSTWRGGVVLAAWPDATRLASIARDSRTRALGVLVSETRDVTEWWSLAQPVPLGVHVDRLVEAQPPR